jgi:hypothetical protein
MTRLALVRKIIMLALLVILLLETPFGTPSRSQQTVALDLSTTNDSINKAFFSVHQAELNGADVSQLVEKLNVAIILFQKAQAENATYPSGAITDLENATSIAHEVGQEAAAISNYPPAGQLRWYESVYIVLATLAVSALVYLNGDRVYRRLWLLVYRRHLVRKRNE